MKTFKIGSFRREACAGGRRSHAPAPPWWNARSARVFGCSLRTVMEQSGGRGRATQQQTCMTTLGCLGL